MENKINEDYLLEKYSWIYWSPFMAWIFLWVNAIRDSAVYVDWPDCNFYRADMIYKTHDLFSTLKSPSTDTRLYFSWVMPNKMVTWYDEKIHRKLGFIENNTNFNLGVVTCMPVTSLLWIQYDGAFRDYKNKDYIFVKSFTDKFRIDWYSLFLRELAKNINFDLNSEKKDKHISIIWFMFDRNEWDCKWNINEINRILNLFDIKIDTIWLSWWNYSDLKKVENSSLLVTFPYWDYASKVLSRNLWVKSISTSIPFWINSTIKFIKDITKFFELDNDFVDKIINKELKRIKNFTDMFDENVFLNKSFFYSWDQNLNSWFYEISDYYWMNLKKTFSYDWSKESCLHDDKDLDFYIWNSEAYIEEENIKKIEFWFPSYNKHYILDRPFMWFNWFLNISEDIYNTLSDF